MMKNNKKSEGRDWAAIEGEIVSCIHTHSPEGLSKMQCQYRGRKKKRKGPGGDTVQSGRWAN